MNRKVVMCIVWGVGSGALGASILTGGKSALLFILGLLCVVLA